jgi:hypothetical protein
MKITIHDTRIVSEIQNEFNEMFPYLKLEFFTKMHEPGKPSHLKFRIPASSTIGESRSIHLDGSLTVTPQMTVNELEQQLGHLFGLGVQVFRKTGESWIETITSDAESLEYLNNLGEELTQIRKERQHGL